LDRPRREGEPRFARPRAGGDSSGARGSGAAAGAWWGAAFRQEMRAESAKWGAEPDRPPPIVPCHGANCHRARRGGARRSEPGTAVGGGAAADGTTGSASQGERRRLRSPAGPAVGARVLLKPAGADPGRVGRCPPSSIRPGGVPRHPAFRDRSPFGYPWRGAGEGRVKR